MLAVGSVRRMLDLSLGEWELHPCQAPATQKLLAPTWQPLRESQIRHGGAHETGAGGLRPLKKRRGCTTQPPVRGRAR